MLNIREVARDYGIAVNAQGKALCPFHNDTHPSLSFKNDYFTCFSCGMKGDVFTLVQQLTGVLKPIEALKLLNGQYNLGMNLDKLISREVATRYKKEAATIKSFEQWVCIADERLHEHYRQLQKSILALEPKLADDPWHPRFCEALRRLALIEASLDAVFLHGGFKEQVSLYILCNGEIERIIDDNHKQ